MVGAQTIDTVEHARLVLGCHHQQFTAIEANGFQQIPLRTGLALRDSNQPILHQAINQCMMPHSAEHKARSRRTVCRSSKNGRGSSKKGHIACEFPHSVIFKPGRILGTEDGRPLRLSRMRRESRKERHEANEQRDVFHKQPTTELSPPIKIPSQHSCGGNSSSAPSMTSAYGCPGRQGPSARQRSTNPLMDAFAMQMELSAAP